MDKPHQSKNNEAPKTTNSSQSKKSSKANKKIKGTPQNTSNNRQTKKLPPTKKIPSKKRPSKHKQIQKIQEEEKKLHNIIGRFSINLEQLRDYIELVNPILLKESKKEFSRYEQEIAPFIAAFCIATGEEVPDGIEANEDSVEIEKKGDQTTFTFKTPQKAKSTMRAIKSLRMVGERTKFLYQTSLLSLISNVEFFWSQLLHSYLRINPHLVTDKNSKSFTFDELLDFENIEAARMYLVEQKIESILRGSFASWIKYIRETLKVDITSLNSIYEETNELFLRRNLIVHNGGIVNDTYLNKVGESYLKANPVEKGDTLEISQEYLEKAITLLEIYFTTVAIKIWEVVARAEKWDAEQEDKFFNVVHEQICFEHLKNERLPQAEHLFKILEDSARLSDANRTIAKINRWIAIRDDGRISEIRDEVMKTDFSAKELLFRVGRLALLEDYDNLYPALEELIEKDARIDAEVLKSWPIFKPYRRKRKFQAIVKKAA